MTPTNDRWCEPSLPYAPPSGPGWTARRWRRAQLAAYGLLAAILLVVTVQFEYMTLRNFRKLSDPAFAAASGDPDKVHKGAIGRWRAHIQKFWRGANIYLSEAELKRAAGGGSIAGQPSLHPNSLPVLILLTPFTWMPVWLMALSFTLLKAALVLPIAWMAVRLACHNGQRMGALAALLGVLAGLDFLVADLQHGNTNVLVAAAVVGHLWLFRRGRDWSAGGLLAVGVVLKMTPALFLLYWLGQRQWKVVGGLLVGLAVLLLLLPLSLLGPDRYADLTGAWWRNLIRPGLVRGAWYPGHLNQSLPGMVARYLIGSGRPESDINWDPDDHQTWSPDGAAWVSPWDLGPAGAKAVLRVLQVVIVLAGAWAIGWRRLPRDDGRRALHYGIVLASMLLLNQRSWDHHAAYMVGADVALMYALFQGRLGRRFRVSAGVVLGLSVVLTLVSGDVLKLLLGEGADDYAKAYGKAFWHFLTVWALCVILAVRLRALPQPYQAAG